MMAAPKPLTEPCSECEDGTIWRSKYGGNDPDVWAVKCGVCDGTGELTLDCDQCSTYRRTVEATEMVDGLPYCAACAAIARDEFAEEELFLAADASHPPMLNLEARFDEYRREHEGNGQ
jgi:hypothetical protein